MCVADPDSGRAEGRTGEPGPAGADLRWSTRVEETVGAAGIALALGLAVLLVDPVGRLLVGGAALLLAGLAVRDRVLAPRLRAEDHGVVVTSLGRTRTVGWPDLRARVRSGRRLGLRTTTLELEDARDDTVLVVLGRRDLGAHPVDVAAALLARSGQNT